MRTYIYQIKPVRPDFPAAMTESESAVLGRHFEYLQDLLAKGRLVMAGPCEDAAFGIAVYYAEDDSAAAAVLANDPVIIEGVMTGEWHPYRISLFTKDLQTSTPNL